MKNRFHISSIVIALVFLQACSVTSWTIVDEQAKDPSDFELINTQYYLETEGNVTPDQPVIGFQLKAINSFEYVQRVRSERFIQRYRPRLGYVMLGAAGAGLSYYAAFSDKLISEPTNSQRYALVGAGTLLTGLSFLNMKPVGESSSTGESRLLRRTGTVIETDTTDADAYDPEINALVTITHEDTLLVQNEVGTFGSGELTINLAEEIDAGVFNESSNQKLHIEVEYDTLKASEVIPVSSVFEQFVIVDAQITALRNEPSFDPENILTDLAQGSQLELVEREGDWYKVLYGISETWVNAEDVRKIWRPSEFATDLSVIAIPNIPFGSVEIEKNIPEIRQSEQNRVAFIIANDQYSGEFSERIYGDRDAALMDAYFTRALGVRENRVISSLNINSQSILERGFSRLSNAVTDSTHAVSIYISGYGAVQDSTAFLVGSNNDTENDISAMIDLRRLFESLASLSVRSLSVFVDLDFIKGSASMDIYEKLASTVTETPNSAVIFSSGPDQRSGIYSSSFGEHNRHSIFTYYLAEAIKQGKITIGEVYDHLERNVSFTSRSIYDRPQDPILFGNPEIEILN